MFLSAVNPVHTLKFGNFSWLKILSKQLFYIKDEKHIDQAKAGDKKNNFSFAMN